MSRAALLAVLGVTLLLYVSPVHHWIVRTRAAGELRATVRDLERERERLEARARALRRPDALEREARRLGMVKGGERPFVIQPAPPGR